MRINRQACGLAALATVAMMAAGCGGEGGEEAVFLYFINGYPGTGSMSINGNTGSLVTNVPFGERFGDDGSCGPDAKGCLPQRVERQLGSRWTVLLENMVQQVDLEADLFSMYPHETGTVILGRRDGETSVSGTLLRHTQSISSDCNITFLNGLSLDNQYLTLSKYDIAPEFRLDDISIGGFRNEATTQFQTECGKLPLDDPTHDELQRPEVLAAVAADPWFYASSCQTETGSIGGACTPGWGLPVADGRSRLGDGGSFTSIRNSAEYFECVEAAISIKAPEDSMVPIFPGAEVECPPAPLTWADVEVDRLALQECLQPIAKSTNLVAAGGLEAAQGYYGQLICNAEFRIRNVGLDIVFGPAGNDALGKHGDGELINSQVDIPAGSQRFWVLLGRPVNPIVWQWDSSETFVDLANFPYFNEGGDRPVVGDYEL